jgi:hypothetical protein
MLYGYVMRHGQQNIKKGDVFCLIRQVQQNYDVLRLNSTQLFLVCDDVCFFSESVSATI